VPESEETLQKIAPGILAELGISEKDVTLVGDPELKLYRQWGTALEYTKLEKGGAPGHGLFLVDGEGRIRWEDVGRHAFTDTDFLLAEVKRLGNLR
jgi:hypothetical protein